MSERARLGQTPWQTVGPFFHYGLPWKGGADLIGGSDIGARPEHVREGHFLLRGPAKRGAIAGEPIEISLVCDGTKARLTVRDHGIGISEEDQARIFDAFERAVSRREEGGFGIGLWMVF